MDEKIEMLLYGQHYKKFQESFYAPLLQKYQITLLDLRVLLFFSEHKQQNTAKDLVEMHHFTKSNVSKSVDALIDKGYLVKIQDSHDRRCMHLEILPAAEPVLDRAKYTRQQMLQVVFQGITEKEVEVIGQVARKITANIAQALEERKDCCER